MPGIISPTANFTTSSLGRLLQLTTNRTGLIGEFLYGRDLATSQVNSAGLKANAAEQLAGGPAAPVYGDHQVELGNGAGHDTGIEYPTGAQTIVMVVAPQLTDAASIAGTGFLAGASVTAINGRMTLLSNAGVGAYALISDTTTTRVDLPAYPRPLNDFRGVICSLAGSAQGSTLTLGEYKAGGLVQQATAPLAVARSAPGVTMSTGNGSALPAGSGYPQRALFAARLDYARELTAAEKLAVYLELRAFLAPWKAI